MTRELRRSTTAMREPDTRSAPVTRIKISASRLEEELPRIFNNKVILSFEGAYTRSQAKNWISSFNEDPPSKLTYGDSLINSLFAAEVIESPAGGGLDEFIRKSFAKAGGHFATFNSYRTMFDPQNPVEFKYFWYQLLSAKAHHRRSLSWMTFLPL